MKLLPLSIALLVAIVTALPAIAEEELKEMKEQIVDGAESTAKSSAKTGIDAAAEKVVGQEIANSEIVETGKSIAKKKSDAGVKDTADSARAQFGLKEKVDEAAPEKPTK